MATLATGAATLMDWAKTRDPDGKTAKIVELLQKRNGLVKTMLWKEGNLPTGHQTTVRTGLPDVYWRLLNAGVQTSKSESAQITEGCGMLEAYSEVDKDLAELNGDLGAYRLSEAEPFFESMNQEMSSTSFYGNSSIDPEEFSGLSIRYSSLSAGNAQNIINAGGSGSADKSSIWLVTWGDQQTCGIFPKGSKAGLSHEDLGLVTVEKSQGTGGGGQRMRAYLDHFQWKAGISVRDWRYNVRICNIDISDLVAETDAPDLFKLMIKAIHRLPMLGVGKPVFYMNRTVFEYLDIQGRDNVKAGGQLKYSEVAGLPQYSFRGIPVEIDDALTESESVVS